jgi:hypothetical protein
MKQNIINHIAMVIDRSGSMSGREASVEKVVDAQIAHLALRSKELDQETRVTVYVFDGTIDCIVYDKDVLRLPSLAGQFRPRGSTALIRATMKSIEDLRKTPELYGDHGFLVYVITDGGENCDNGRAGELAKLIGGLKDNWTVAAFVPDILCKAECQRFGFPKDNIAIWDTNRHGVAEIGETIRQTTDAYMTGRTVGTRGYKNLFTMNTRVDKAAVAAALPKLHPGQYRMAPVTDAGPIAPFVEQVTKRAYKLGEAFYQLSKPEKVQASKQVALFDKQSKAVYTGAEARGLLGLPDHEVRVAPANFPDFEIFVQSGSVNRKLVPGTRLLLLS